jgi:hypothetical protein
LIITARPNLSWHYGTPINVLANEVQTYEWTNVTQISHLINLCKMCVQICIFSIIVCKQFLVAKDICT